MDEAEIERVLRLEKIFMPQSMRQRLETIDRQKDPQTGVEPSELRFAHYTTAEAALAIMRTKCLWMRNTTCMTDYREVRHGFDILQGYFSDIEKTQEFAAALDVCFPGAAMEAINKFNNFWGSNLPLNIFVASMSEHSQKEDAHGRLSMWRAFGANSTRVAIVIKIPRFTESAQALGVMFSPVAYLTTGEVHATIKEVIANISSECDFLRSLDRARIINHVFYMFLAAVSCLKHEGYREEQEWRAVYTPQVLPSALMKSEVENVRGVPQHVFKVPLDGAAAASIADLDLAKIIDRVIIGPSPYPWVIYQAFVEELAKAGVANAASKVFTSGIPIRPGY